MMEITPTLKIHQEYRVEANSTLNSQERPKRNRTKTREFFSRPTIHILTRILLHDSKTSY